jgi:hypothetical protein
MPRAIRLNSEIVFVMSTQQPGASRIRCAKIGHEFDADRPLTTIVE